MDMSRVDLGSEKIENAQQVAIYILIYDLSDLAEIKSIKRSCFFFCPDFIKLWT